MEEKPLIHNMLCVEQVPPPCGLIIFGASGDLAERKLIPSLYHLDIQHLLPERFFLIGTGRSEMTHEAFREKLKVALHKFARAGPIHESIWDEFLQRFYYLKGDYGSLASYTFLADFLKKMDDKYGTNGNRLFYLAVPPNLYGSIIQYLGKSGLAGEKYCPELCMLRDGWCRVIIEKPFGSDLTTARELDQQISRVFSEEQIYRIDHYLGKETVQNILFLRFANTIFEPVWNRNYIDHVQITVAETLGVEHRAGYYEGTGALRDMFQNHMLQLLAFVAMEPPVRFGAQFIRDEKLKVFRSIRDMSTEEIDHSTVRGQYGAGEIDGRKVAAYREEEGIPGDSATETFAALRVFIDNWRWQNVPFYLRSGKRLPKRVTEIAIQFKTVPHLLFEPIRQEDIAPNTLILRIQPDEGISLAFQAKHPGAKLCMQTVEMDFDYESSFGTVPPEAYERLLLDCMVGDQTLFNHRDGVERCWELITPILKRWEELPPETLHFYRSGTLGPAESHLLLERDGRKWRQP